MMTKKTNEKIFGDLISVVVPIYNVDKFLVRCLESIIKQTYQNIEILLIDDGSIDSSPKICDEYARKDERIKVFHKKNAGVSAARNDGIRAAKGLYISFVDGDDVIKPNMIEKMYLSAQKADVVFCNYSVCTDKSNNTIKHGFGNRVFCEREIREFLITGFFYDTIPGLNSMCNKLYKTKTIREHNLQLDENIARAEDKWFNFEFFSVATMIQTIDDNLYCYMQDNQNSAMHLFRENQYELWVANRKRLLAIGEQMGIAIDEYKFYNTFLKKVIPYLVRALCYGNNNNRIKEILRDDFLTEATQYYKGLPLHIKIGVIMIRLRAYSLAYRYLNTWANWSKYRNV